MLVKLRLRGVYFVPGVPKTAQVTQETEQNYGPFNTCYFQNLETLVKSRHDRNMTLSVADIPLLIFGGKDGDVELEDAFTKAFSVENNLAVWAKVGACPLTRACLLDQKVAHQAVTGIDGVVDVDVDADPMAALLVALEEANHRACDHLSAQGCDGNQLRHFAPRASVKVAVSQAYNRELQDAIVEATTAEKHVHATDGDILNSDDDFIAQERNERERQASMLEKDKKARLAAKQRQEDALAVVVELGKRSVDVYNDSTDLEALVFVDELKVLVAWKLGGEQVPTTKDPLIASWVKSKNSDEYSSFEEWTPNDEARLGKLLDEDIAVASLLALALSC
jgi:hypothetical protein